MTRGIHLTAQASSTVETIKFVAPSTIDSRGEFIPASGLPKIIERDPTTPVPRTIEVYLRRLTHCMALMSAGEVETGASSWTSFTKAYITARWKAWVSLYAFYCSHFNLLGTRCFISPAGIIGLMREEMEPAHGRIAKDAVEFVAPNMMSQVGNFRRGKFALVTDLEAYYQAKGSSSAVTLADGLDTAAGWKLGSSHFPGGYATGEAAHHSRTWVHTPGQEGKRNTVLMHVLKECLQRWSNENQTAHVWVSLFDAIQWNKSKCIIVDGLEEYFRNCVELINDIQKKLKYANVFKHHVKPPAMVFHAPGFCGNPAATPRRRRTIGFGTRSTGGFFGKGF